MSFFNGLLQNNVFLAIQCGVFSPKIYTHTGTSEQSKYILFIMFCLDVCGITMAKEVETRNVQIGSTKGGVEGRRNHVLMFQIK